MVVNNNSSTKNYRWIILNVIFLTLTVILNLYNKKAIIQGVNLYIGTLCLDISKGIGLAFGKLIYYIGFATVTGLFVLIIIFFLLYVF